MDRSNFISLWASCLLLLLFTPFVADAQSFEALTPNPPYFLNVSGEKITSSEAGRQIMIDMNVRNNVEQDMPFVSLIEVRDESGVAVFLAWQTGNLPASDPETSTYNNTTMGFSWLPESPATYEARTFVISSLENPQILSGVEVAQITIT